MKLRVFVVWFLLDLLVLTNGSEELMANAVNSIADYLSVDCVYFLTSLSESADISKQKLAKILSLKFSKPVAFSPFSAYPNLTKGINSEQCQKPLRVILELSSTAISKNFKEYHWMNSSYSDIYDSGAWMIFIKSFHNNFVAELFRNIYLPVDNLIIIAWIHNQMVHFKEAYQVSRSHPMRQPYLGNYTLKTGLLSEGLLYNTRTNLEGLQLKVAYIDDNIPFITKTQNGYLGGYFGEIWTTLEDILNISSTYIKVDFSRGDSDSENSWMTVLNMIKEKKADVGIADFIVSSKRIDFLDFSYPLLKSSLQMYYSNPPKGRYSHGYLISFESDTWLALVIWAVVNSLCISFNTFICKRFIRKSEKSIDVFTSVFISFGGLCGQGVSCFPRYLSCRMLFFYVYVVATIVIPSYSASLTRHLAAKPSELIINNLNDFYRGNFQKIIVVNGSYEYFSLKLTRNKKLRKLYEKYGAHESQPKSYNEALLHTCSGKNIAFFTFTATLNWELNKAENAHIKDDCPLRKMTQNAGMLFYSIIYPKKSRYRKIIDFHLKNLQKTGIIQKLEQKYWMNGLSLRKKRWNSINLQNTIAVFQIILFGTILGLILLILEQLLMSRSRRKSKEKRRLPRVFS